MHDADTAKTLTQMTTALMKAQGALLAELDRRDLSPADQKRARRFRKEFEAVKAQRAIYIPAEEL
jgi:hypothetical protein